MDEAKIFVSGRPAPPLHEEKETDNDDDKLHGTRYHNSQLKNDTIKERIPQKLGSIDSSTTTATAIDARFLRIENILREQEATRQRALELKQDITEGAKVIKAAAEKRKAKDDEFSVWTKDMMMTIRYMRAEDND